MLWRQTNEASTEASIFQIFLNISPEAFFFFPCRNPALEDQACDRIYRVGQQKDVVIHRSGFSLAVNEAVAAHVLSGSSW